MYRRQLVTHIAREIKRGIPEAEIANELLRDGWPESDIKEAFNYCSHPEKLRHFSLARVISAEMPAWIELVSIFTVIVTFVVFGIFFSFFREKVYSYELNVPGRFNIENNLLFYGTQSSLSNKNYFEEVKKQFQIDKVSFISVDLSEMKLYVYKDGLIVDQVDVVAKGREGSWWETPAGLYRIENKERSHYSTFGNVYQPWSMAFQGNFFIHGWPEYPDGTPVEGSYSGGCIRLSTADAERIYNLVSLGTPVLVYEKDFFSDGKKYDLKSPQVSASRYLAADVRSGFVFLERGADSVAPIASITKLMTALISAEYINLDKDILIDGSMMASTSKPRLKVGQKVSAYQLMFPLLLESSNEAAEALARSGGRRDEFIRRMNSKAASLGMSKTVFVDPSGVGEGNRASLEDLFTLAKYVYLNRSFLFQISSGNLTKSAYGGPNWPGIQNFNDFAGIPSYIGGKVGKSTPAGETAVQLFEINVDSEKRVVAIIVLGSDNGKADVENILSFIEDHFE